MARRTVAAFCFPLVSNSDIILPRKVWGYLKKLAMLQRAPIYSTKKGKSFGAEEKLDTGAQKVLKMLCSKVVLWMDGCMMMRLTWGLWRGCGSVAYWGAAAPPQRKGDRLVAAESTTAESAAAAETNQQKVQQQQMRLLQSFLWSCWLQK